MCMLSVGLRVCDVSCYRSGKHNKYALIVLATPTAADITSYMPVVVTSASTDQKTVLVNAAMAACLLRVQLSRRSVTLGPLR